MNSGPDVGRWELQTSNTSADLYAVESTPAGAWYAVGSGGSIVMTTGPDVGRWELQTSNTSADLYDVRFEGNTGFAIGSGGVIVMNSGPDVGRWEKKVSGLSSGILKSISFVGPARGLIVGSGSEILLESICDNCGTRSCPASDGLACSNDYQCGTGICSNIGAVTQGIGTCSCVVDTDGDGINDTADLCPFNNPGNLDADRDGCTDNIDGLTKLIKNFRLNHGIENALLVKVSSNSINSTELRNLLNQVKALRGKKLTNDQADMLTSYINNVIAQM